MTSKLIYFSIINNKVVLTDLGIAQLIASATGRPKSNPWSASDLPKGAPLKAKL